MMGKEDRDEAGGEARATPRRASWALLNFEFHPESNGKLPQASGAKEWNGPCFVFKLSQAVMCVKQTVPPQSAGPSPGGRASNSRTGGDE